MGGGQSTALEIMQRDRERPLRKKPLGQGTKDVPERPTLPPLRKGGRPELTGAHHSRCDNRRVPGKKAVGEVCSLRTAQLQSLAGPSCKGQQALVGPGLPTAALKSSCALLLLQAY